MNETHPTLAKRATALLAAEEVAFEAPSSEDRARSIALISKAIEEAAHRRRLLRMGALGVAIAAACACAIVFFAMRSRSSNEVAQPAAPTAPSTVGSSHAVVAMGRAMEGDAVAWHAGAQSSLDHPVAVDVGDRIVASADARAALTLSTGTRIVLEGGSELEVIEQDATQIYALRAGAVRADVAKLGLGERFLVRTSDVEVEVRGTSFRVSLVAPDSACGAGTPTRLAVDEGVVVVRAAGLEDRISAGETWPRGCGASTLPAATTSASSIATPSPSVSIASNKLAIAPSTIAPTTASDLQAQNDLFALGVAQKHAGSLNAAIAIFERLLAKYPAGPLAESATVERMRSLALLDPSRGALAAKGYLARYPHGFARVEAEGLAGP